MYRNDNIKDKTKVTNFYLYVYHHLLSFGLFKRSSRLFFFAEKIGASSKGLSIYYFHMQTINKAKEQKLFYGKVIQIIQIFFRDLSIKATILVKNNYSIVILGNIKR